MKRIERENFKIAQKIFSMKPSFRVTELENEYTYHKRMVANMKKI